MYYKDKTYLPTLYSLWATVQISCRLSLLCAQLHAAARRQCSPSQSAVCNYAVSLLQTLILQHPDPGLPLRIQMPGWQVLCFNLQNAWYHSSKNYIKGSLYGKRDHFEVILNLRRYFWDILLKEWVHQRRWDEKLIFHCCLQWRLEAAVLQSRDSRRSVTQRGHTSSCPCPLHNKVQGTGGQGQGTDLYSYQ